MKPCPDLAKLAMMHVSRSNIVNSLIIGHIAGRMLCPIWLYISYYGRHYFPFSRCSCLRLEELLMLLGDHISATENPERPELVSMTTTV